MCSPFILPAAMVLMAVVLPVSQDGAERSPARPGLPCAGVGGAPPPPLPEGPPGQGARQGVLPDGDRAGEEQTGTSQPAFLLQPEAAVGQRCRQAKQAAPCPWLPGPRLSLHLAARLRGGSRAARLKITPEGFSGSDGSRNGWRVGRNLPEYQKLPFQLCKLSMWA